MTWLITLLMSVLTTSCLFSEISQQFSIEHAFTPEQMRWGLMGRRFLGENQGMLFHYPEAHQINIWSFNCYIDLSVAFIDENRVVREIKTLHAFPQMMDPARPILCSRDFDLYSASDPIVIFFYNTSVTASIPVKYVLEMNKGWFERNHVHVGDILHWDESGNTAVFKTLQKRESSQ